MDEESVIEAQKKVEALVYELLARDERARNDDVWLVIQAWRKMGVYVLLSDNDTSRITSAESITRQRRKIQNTNGEFLPTDPQVLVQRRVKEDILRRYFGEDSVVYRMWDTIKT
jgi:hypothetical protein